MKKIINETELKNIIKESIIEVLNEEITSFNSAPYQANHISNNQTSNNTVYNYNKAAIRYTSIAGTDVHIYHYGTIEVYSNNKLVGRYSVDEKEKNIKYIKANTETSKKIAEWWSKCINPYRFNNYENGCNWKFWAGLL